MYASSSLLEDQHEAAVTWFGKGIADSAAARLLHLSRAPVKRLYRPVEKSIVEEAEGVNPDASALLEDLVLNAVERSVAASVAVGENG